MSRSVVYKINPTISIDDVERDLEAFQINHEYTERYVHTTTLSPTDIVSLPGPTSFPTTDVYIKFLASLKDIELSYKDDVAATITLPSVLNILGNIKGYDYSIENVGSEDIDIEWEIFY